MSFKSVTELENKVAEFYGAPYAIATDCCTHSMELCLLYTNETEIDTPYHTYASVPMLADKLYLKRNWIDLKWEDYYYITPNIIDAAVLWKKDSYIPETFMCLSFQNQKHLSIGRGGMILTDNKEAANILRKMSYDGRERDIKWAEQDIDIVGYHYYMTPEMADIGLSKLENAKKSVPIKWTWENYPNLKEMSVFK